jgi:hypothetical protein
MQGKKFQLKANICANFQENTVYQDSGGMMDFDGMTLLLCLGIQLKKRKLRSE